MTAQTMLVIDPNALQGLHDEIAALRRLFEGGVLQPRPDWMNVNDYAAYIGKSRRTVLRMIATGSIEVKYVAGVRMIKV